MSVTLQATKLKRCRQHSTHALVNTQQILSALVDLMVLAAEATRSVETSFAARALRVEAPGAAAAKAAAEEDDLGDETSLGVGVGSI